jgi:hypothetical protein
MAATPKQPSPKFIGNPAGSQSLAAALANSKNIVDQAKK